MKIPIKIANCGYYIRWYYNGWHYWFFLPGTESQITEGQNYWTIGTRRLSLGTGQMTIAQCTAVRTILNTREVQLYTSDGWKNIRIEPTTIPIDNNFIDGTEFEIVAIIGSKEVSYVTGYSPITPPPIVPPKYYGYGALYNGYVLQATYDDWFLPDHDELFAMYNELKVHSVGGFAATNYWCSTEASAYTGVTVNFMYGNDYYGPDKTALKRVRACRSFISSDTFALRDKGQAGGLIFAIVDNEDGTFTYYEAAPTDQSSGYLWSNKNTPPAVGASGGSIGDGQANTAAIIAQSGHTDSAAKLCDDLSIEMKFCPNGYHVMTAEEAGVIAAALDSTTVAGGKMKEAGLAHWLPPNTDADNSSGFTGLPAGIRNIDGVFSMQGEMCAWWLITEALGVAYLLNNTAELAIESSEISPNFGISVRWVKDDGLIGDGIVTDIDGNDYELVDIGGVVVTKASITVEHFTDGTPIPIVPDNVEWANKTSEAMCYSGTNPTPEDETTTVDPAELNWDDDEVDVKTFVVTTAMSRWYFASASTYDGFTVTVWDPTNTEQVLDGVYTSGMVVRVNPIAINEEVTNKHFYLMIANASDEIIAGTTVIGTQYAAGYGDPPTFDHNPSWGEYPSAWVTPPTASAAWHDEEIYITGTPSGFYSGAGTRTMYVWVTKAGVLCSDVLSFGAKDGMYYTQWITVDQLDNSLYQIYYDSVDRSLE